MEYHMRILGLDVGTKTVGVAVSDEMGWTAQGLETVKIDEEINWALNVLKKLLTNTVLIPLWSVYRKI